jgi:hypothetical protein
MIWSILRQRRRSDSSRSPAAARRRGKFGRRKISSDDPVVHDWQKLDRFEQELQQQYGEDETTGGVPEHGQPAVAPADDSPDRQSPKP